MLHERVAILLGGVLGARVLPQNLVLRRQHIDQGMPAEGGLLALTGRLVVWIPENPHDHRTGHGSMLKDHGLRLRSGDVRPVTVSDLEKFLDPIHDKDVAVLVEVPVVARVEPALGVDDPSSMDPTSFMNHAQAMMPNQSGAGGQQGPFGGQDGGHGGGYGGGRGSGRRW